MSPTEPLRVVVVDDCELVRAGLSRMLQAYPERVHLVDDDWPGAVDVVLQGDRPEPRNDWARWASGREIRLRYTWDGDFRAGEVSKYLTGLQLVAELERLAGTASAGVRAAEDDSWPGRAEGLSRREAEILARIGQGLSNDEVAKQMYLSINTIKSYVRSAYRKIGVSRRSQAVLWARDHRLQSLVRAS